MIELRDLVFSYADRPVLNGVSLSLTDGMHAAVMGPSGAGKSTLLRLAMGLAQPKSGLVRRSGRIACVFQEPRLLPWCTALENVNCVLSDGPETLPAAEKWLSALELSACAGLYPDALSGGMQQRLAIARALAFGGDTLLLDEPFKGFDADLREEVIALLQRECAGKTLLLVTHDADAAARLAERTYLLSDGVLKIM